MPGALGNEAFDEMIANDRFQRIWQVGGGSLRERVRERCSKESICMEVSKIHIIIPTVQTTQ
ncbi:hypothetical protein NSMM_380030 [Nitrosomonas mobilis]|uniref:Uncharacterized protein n=1 Tax=Nitrosomonas mobilis TaxID=51642 RepID=A0A1G5SE76_9PROT|nr:hypothetical protein NSMM_380030 [Nitrosomonas mobilis]